MIKKYKELELVDSDYDLSLRCNEVDGFLPISVINKIKKHTETTIGGFWDDSPYNIEVYKLDDVFPLLISNGWRYINTYWKGGSEKDAHRVLTFVSE